MDKATYLGDGVYASFDGYQMRLYTERDNGIHEIFLEPGVYQSLVEEWKRIHEPA